MPEVNVEINGRKYRMACEEGQEPHLLGLAERFNRHIDAFKGDFGEIGDNRLTVMAGIAVLDELVDAERRIALLKDDVANLTAAGEALTQEAEQNPATGQVCQQVPDLERIWGISAQPGIERKTGH